LDSGLRPLRSAFIASQQSAVPLDIAAQAIAAAMIECDDCFSPIASASLFLCSQQANFITGQSLAVAGGLQL
jgi:NAD(P)-dependent dehydrogenase (short-subunit alcohol dehydrogenase family)